MIAIRLLLTTLITIAAVSAGIYVWDQVFFAPWTRDAHVRADIVEVGPRVSGNIVDVAVRNNAHVAVGDILLNIDQSDFLLALQRAEAARDAAEAQAELQRQQSKRLDSLKAIGSQAVADVAVETADLQTRVAEATLQAAEAAVRTAKLDLERTVVRSPVAGWITNLSADTGDTATANIPVLAVIDEASFRVDAFFLETALPRITVGAAARVKLMSSPETLTGRVAGIAAGISFAEDTSAALLQSPEPAFRWVRLAQRVPVEITLDAHPTAVPLVNGATATVIIEAPGPTLWEKTMTRLSAQLERL